jgi:hypothetical protein
MLHRTGSVDEFAKRFMALSCRDPTITEQQQIQLFTTGMGDPLRLDVALQQPASMDDVVIFARAYEQRLLSRSTGGGGADGATRIGPPGRMIHTASRDSAGTYIGSVQGTGIFISDNGPPFYAGRDRSTT